MRLSQLQLHLRRIAVPYTLSHSVFPSASQRCWPLCVPTRSFSQTSITGQQHSSGSQSPKTKLYTQASASASSTAAPPLFLSDRNLEQGQRLWKCNKPNVASFAPSRPSSAASGSVVNRSRSSPATSKTRASFSSTSASPRLHIQRKMECSNKVVVLHPAGSRVVTLDLSIEVSAATATSAALPTTVSSSLPTPNSNSSHTKPFAVVKSMAREEQEVAAKTLDRIRLLFAPPRPKGKPSKKTTKEEILAACPVVRAFVRADEVAGILEERKTEEPKLTLSSGSVVKLPRFEKGEKTGTETDYQELNPELANNEFWKYARVLLLADKTPVQVLYNVPTITSISSPGVPYVGLPLAFGNISVLFAKEEQVSYEWCVLPVAGTAAAAPSNTNLSAKNCAGANSKTISKTSSNNSSNNSAAEEATFRVVGRSSTFTPTSDLVGRSMMLRASLDPATGLWTELRLPDVVRPLPPPVERWQETATAVAFPAFRVVTYNILYDDFCTSKSSKSKIYPFATNEILDLENRKVRIVQELLAYHTDLICLQECGRDVFQSYLLPVMKALGYDGVYVNKAGMVKEGCGFLFRLARFELVKVDSLPLNYTTLRARHPELAARVGECAELAEALNAVTSIGARVVLRDVVNQKEMVLGNTHLFYHANGCHIRLLQVYMLLHWLHEAATGVEGDKTAKKSDAAAAAAAAGAPLAVRPVVLCGDFNCTHVTGAYRLLTTGQVEASHPSWEKGKVFWWGCSRLLGYDAERLEELLGEEAVLPQDTIARKDFKRQRKTPNSTAPGPSAADKGEDDADDVASHETGALPATSASPAASPVRGDDHVVTNVFREALHAPPLHLVDAYQRTDPSMQWTNFTLTFREVIDYVFFSRDSIEVLRTVPIPPESELAENFALPNQKYPSDHVALVADLSHKA